MKKIERAYAKLVKREILSVSVLIGATLPFVAAVVLGAAGGAPSWVALSTGVAIVAAAYALSWATESLQTVMSQALALAILALIQVLPEYSFEAILAWQGRLDFASATMTGANRLLLGFGWPLILLISFFSSLRAGKPLTSVKLGKEQSVEVLFLLVASTYSLIIVSKASLSLMDSAILIAIFMAYIWAASRMPKSDSSKLSTKSNEAKPYRALIDIHKRSGSNIHAASRSKAKAPHNKPERKVSTKASIKASVQSEADGEDHESSIVAAIITLPRHLKFLAISSLLAFGGFVILLGAEPFIDSLMEVAIILGISQYLFLQWIAPFLSEFPESITAFLWANKVKLAPMGIANLISSKLNQWTLLIATIPIAYNLGLGQVKAAPLTSMQTQEILLTAAQTLYGVSALLDLSFDMLDALALLGLFLAQFFVPEIRLEVTIAYFGLTVLEVLRKRKKITIFQELRAALMHKKP